MVHILAQVNINEMPVFLGTFATKGAGLRRKHGSQRAQIFRVAGEENSLVVLFEWESRESFEQFLSDPATRDTMASSGTVGRPNFTYLEGVAELPG